MEQGATEYRFTRPDFGVRVLIIVLEIEFELKPLCTSYHVKMALFSQSRGSHATKPLEK